MVLIEAMTYCKPVIGTDIGGITDIIINNKTGLLVPQRDPGAIAQAVSAIFSNQNNAQKLALRGFDYIQSNFSWSTVINRFNAIYKSL